MSLSHRCGFIWAHSTVIANAWPLQNLNLVFLEPFRGELAGVFRIIVLLHNLSALELEVTNWRLDILLQDLLIECRIHGSINYGKSSRSSSCKAAPDHRTTTTCWYDVHFMKSCAGYMPDITGHTPSKKFNFCLSPQNICPKVLGIIKMFFGKCETSLCVLFGQQWLLPWNSPMDGIFAQFLSYCWLP